MENTVIIFTADHGEMLSDHACVHKARPYQGSVHIPKVIKGPWGMDSVRPGLCEDLVELRDVMPTVLDIAGAKSPDLDGQSMLRPIHRDLLHCEHEYGEKSFQMMLS